MGAAQSSHFLGPAPPRILGDIFVYVRYPVEAEAIEDCNFNHQTFRDLLGELQKGVPEWSITLQCSKIDDFCEHAMSYNSDDPDKMILKPRVLLELYPSPQVTRLVRTPISFKVNQTITQTVSDILDPNKRTHIVVRSHLPYLESAYMRYVSAVQRLRL